MKKVLLISFVLFVLVAMVACSSMYSSSGQRVYRARGSVLAYEPGKTVSLVGPDTQIQYTGDEYVASNAPPQAYIYAITPDTEVKGKIEKGTRVLIRYTQTGTGDDAPKTAVSVDAVWSK